MLKSTPSGLPNLVVLTSELIQVGINPLFSFVRRGEGKEREQGNWGLTICLYIESIGHFGHKLVNYKEKAILEISYCFSIHVQITWN